MNNQFQVYDNRGVTLDRYTIFITGEEPDKDGLYPCVGASENGSGFYQHGTATKGRHLGRRVEYDELAPELQKRLLQELDA